MTQQLPDCGDLPIPRQEALDRLVYLVGPPRGGTTIMFFSLGLHEKILALPMLSSFIPHVWRYRRKVHDRLLRLIFREPAWYNERGILRNLESPAKESLARYVKQTWQNKELGSLYGLYPLIYSLDERNRKNPAEIACWADKTNDIHGLDELRAGMPNAKFIIMTRDPRAMVASAMQRAGGAPGRLSRQNVAPILNAAIYWRHMMQTTLRFAARNPEAARIIHYENFVRAPERTLNDVYDFCTGETVPEETLRARLAGLDYWSTNRQSERGHGIDNRPLDRWRTAFSEDEVDLILSVTGPTARKLGYDTEGRGSMASLLRGLALIGPSRAGLLATFKAVYLAGKESFVPNADSGLTFGRDVTAAAQDQLAASAASKA